jgi:hypothetical protein
MVDQLGIEIRMGRSIQRHPFQLSIPLAFVGIKESGISSQNIELRFYIL